MSYALIDNSTLTAVQRVLGQVTVKNPDTINGDITAFENFIQAILFYDDLICIDDYKKQFADKRAKQFNYIRFLSESEFDFAPVKDQTWREASAIRPEIRGGEFADADFKALIEQLKLNIVCTWDMRSSVFYLTMKMLGQPDTPEYDKYSAISSAIYSELSDVAETNGRFHPDVDLVSSEGLRLTDRSFQDSDLGGTTKALDMFIASLNWIAYKSIFYSLSAKYLQADTILHPIRHAFQIHWMSKVGAYGHDFTSKLLGSLDAGISSTCSEILDHGRPVHIQLDLPMFSAWLTQQTGDVTKVIDSAFEIRKSNEFVVLRELLREIRNAYEEQDIASANKLVSKWTKDLNAAMANIKGKFGLKTNNGIASSPIIKVTNTALSVAGSPSFPEFDFKIPKPDFLRNKRERAFGNIIKDITGELVTVERLGGIRDKLGEKFVIDDTRYIAPKTENPKFRYAKSFWKRPM